MSQKILTISFYLLFFATPLLWAPFSFELFEYNKMMAVYLLTIVITGSWLLKMLGERRLLIKRSPLDIPLLIFWGANVLSTIFSIDPHTSWWGYYSRSNGGLLSTTSYLLLYFAFTSNFEKDSIPKLLRAALFSGVIVSVWAIMEHFGVSPSCIVLTGQFTDACWVQDVQARVFATLGQPNWLAAYLAMLIFPALFLLLTSRSKTPLILNTLYLILLYLAFTFTYSRGATLGLIGGVGVVACGMAFLIYKNGPKLLSPLQKRGLAILVGTLIIISLTFGTALTSFKLISKFSPPPRPSISVGGSSQLESGGTESGEIRLIVWKGALAIFKHYPIFGSGVETFAYSYYQFRPAEHNLVSEWDFLYNKAHNEFLNYLATTGAVGFLSYLGAIGAFIFWSIKYYVLSIKNKGALNTRYLILATLAAYISYLVQNMFGFSVVIVALFFYLFPALSFVEAEATYPLQIKSLLTKRLSSLFQQYSDLFIVAKIAVFVLLAVFIITLGRYYAGDIFFAQGYKANEAGNPGRAHNALTLATSLNPGEPFYISELAYSAAGAAVALSEEDTTLSAQLKNEAIEGTDQVLSENPRNVSYFRTAIRTYYLLSALDKSYSDKTLQVLDKTIALAPTDPKLPYNKALLLTEEGKNEEAVKVLQDTIRLKPNYREAYLTLADVYVKLGQKEKAKTALEKVLQMIPNDPEALDRLKKL